MTILGILLTILKIIGIILLVLLLIVLAIILLVLFVPFRYRVHADKDGWNINAGANVSWLLHMISVDVAYGAADSPKRGLTKDIRIFGVSLFKVKDWLAGRKKKKAKQADKQEADTSKPDVTTAETEESEFAAGEAEAAEDTANETAPVEEPAGEAVSEENAAARTEGSADVTSEAKESKDVTSEAKGTEDAAAEAAKTDETAGTGYAEEETSKPVTAEETDAGSEETDGGSETTDAGSLATEEEIIEKSSPVDRVWGITRKIRDILINIPGKVYGIFLKLFFKLIDVLVLICELPGKLVALLGSVIDKILTIYGKITLITDFFFDDRTQDAIHFVLGQVGHLIGHVRPRKLSGYLDFGFYDPSWTGRVLGGLSLFLPQCGKTFDINPDFENAHLECDINSSGRIYLFYLAYIALSTYFNKDIKYVLRYVKHLRKELSQASAA